MIVTRILLLCSSRLALPALQQLSYLNLLGAIVIPQHCDEWAENVQFVVQQSTIPVVLVNKENQAEQIVATIEKYGITMGLMITFSFRIPAVVYTLPIQGFFNVHPGPLPQYRGGDPVFQQIKNREKYAAITLHHVANGYDTGAVVLQERIRLQPTDTYGMLTSSLGQMAAQMILLLLKMMAMEVAIPSKPQDEAKATYYNRHGAKDVTINWQQMDGASIVALINACNPWNKGATTQLNGRIVRLLEAEVLLHQRAPENTVPGTILTVERDNMLVCSNNFILSITLVYLEEGYMNAGRLGILGIASGHIFNSIL